MHRSVLRPLLFQSILAVAWFAGLAAAPAGAATGDLRVMSFNIRTGNANDGINSWNHPTDGVDRKVLVARTINNYNPDILGLQEDLDYQGDYILSNTADRYSMFRRSVNGNGTGEHVAILYRTDRFTRLRQGRFWLSDTPDEVSTFDGANFNRIVNWVELRDVDNPDHSFVVMNTHWEHAAHGASARFKSASLMRQKMTEIAPNTPIIFTGDFNADQDSDPYDRMTGRDNFDNERFLTDTYRNTHSDGGSVGTSHVNFDGNAGSGRIDWILHTDEGFNTIAAAIDRSSFSGRYPSDHFPINATIRPTMVPEPAALSILGLAGSVILVSRRRGKV